MNSRKMYLLFVKGDTYIGLNLDYPHVQALHTKYEPWQCKLLAQEGTKMQSPVADVIYKF